jgi:hypothetical protein
MAVAGASAGAIFSNEVGTIGTNWTFDKVTTFPTPQNLLALPLLRYINETDDETVTEAYVSQYTDNGVSKTGHFMGIAAAKCTKITWTLYCDHSLNNPTNLILYFA